VPTMSRSVSQVSSPERLFDADLIIAGAGCAGLSALWFAAHLAPPETRIIVIDRSWEPSDDRTWGFWGGPDTPFMDVADRTWQQLHVKFPGWESAQKIGGSSNATDGSGSLGRVYARVRQRDFDAAIRSFVANRPHLRLIEADIADLVDEPDGGCVMTSVGDFRAPVIFQSVRLSPEDEVAPVRHRLRQHFGGWEVQTEHPIFDPDVATLMDFDTAQTLTADPHSPAMTAFFYLLPETRDRALIEYTVFSPDPQPAEFYDSQLHQRLIDLGAGKFDITRREYGVIPMEDRRVHQRSGTHVWNLGTVGGMTKPTTGYTFQRIHTQTRHMVTTWLEHGQPSPLPSPPRRYEFADRTLLNILHHHPERGRPIFERLFRTSPIDSVLTFLEENSSPMSDARLFAGLPWGPFLQAAADEIRAALLRAMRTGLNRGIQRLQSLQQIRRRRPL
jgi:lycopene beta-cyclase